MHVHLPKPLHGWREFLGEVGIIVVGVLIALGAEQVVETHDWNQKVAAADAAMTEEVNMALVNAVELDQRKECSAALRIAFIIALTQKDWAKAAMIRAEPSFDQRRFWSDDAHTAAVAGQLSDHFDAERLKAFSDVYTMIRKIRESQDDGWTTDATADMLFIPGLPKSDDVMLDELRSAAKLSRSVGSMEGQGELLLATAKKTLNLSATTQQLFDKPGARDDLLRCRAHAKKWAPA